MVVHAPARDLRLPRKANAKIAELSLESGHEAIGREVAVLGKIDRAGDVHPHIRFERGGLLRVERLRRNPEGARLSRAGCLFVERALRFAQHEQPFLYEAEVVAR